MGQTPDDAEEIVELPPGAKPGPETISVSLPTALLDVTTVPGTVENELGGSAKVLSQAYLRDSNGQVVVRLPSDDLASSLYQRVARSAREGLVQGRPPEVKAEQPKPELPVRDRERRREPPSEGGGGGGGGGG